MGTENQRQTVIGLDLSSKPGYAILMDGNRVASGTSRPSRPLSAHGEYPFNYVAFAESVVSDLHYKLATHLQFAKIKATEVSAVVIEETTASSQNYSQKILEFIHLEFLKTVTALFPNARVVYVRDGTWKSIVGARLNDQEKKNNAKISRLKKKKKEANPEKTRIIVRKDKDGNPIRKVTKYDAYIRCANETFGLELDREAEDEAVALLLCKAFLSNVPICDGTIFGGLFEKTSEN